jgi:opacity protein-like surface antigen
MPRFAQSVLVALSLIPGALQLHAQEHTLGINFRVDAASQLGVTWLVSPSLTIRPSLTASWNKTTTTSPFGGEAWYETAILGVDLDFLFRAATWDRITSYYGLGVSVAHLSSSGNSGLGSFLPSGTAWGGRVLLGVRVRLLERVAFFGEVGLAYQDSDYASSQSVRLTTYPLGIVIFLR